MLPTHIRKKNRSIEVIWSDGHESIFEPNYLRRCCPCVSCKQSPTRNPDGGMALPSYNDALEVTSSQIIGNYAVCFAFNDQHDTGIYPYTYLRQICACPDCKKATSISISVRM